MSPVVGLGALFSLSDSLANAESAVRVVWVKPEMVGDDDCMFDVRLVGMVKGVAVMPRKPPVKGVEPFLNALRQAKISLKINHVGYLCLCLYSGLRRLRSSKSFTCFFQC